MVSIQLLHGKCCKTLQVNVVQHIWPVQYIWPVLEIRLYWFEKLRFLSMVPFWVVKSVFTFFSPPNGKSTVTDNDSLKFFDSFAPKNFPLDPFQTKDRAAGTPLCLWFWILKFTPTEVVLRMILLRNFHIFYTSKPKILIGSYTYISYSGKPSFWGVTPTSSPRHLISNTKISVVR